MDGPAPSRGGVTRAAGLIEPRLYRQLQFRVTNQVCSVIIGLEKFEPSESSSTVTRCQRELVPEQLEFEVSLRHRHTDRGLRATSTSPCQPDCLGVTLGLQVFNSTVTVPPAGGPELPGQVAELEWSTEPASAPESMKGRHGPPAPSRAQSLNGSPFRCRPGRSTRVPTNDCRPGSSPGAVPGPIAAAAAAAAVRAGKHSRLRCRGDVRRGLWVWGARSPGRRVAQQLIRGHKSSRSRAGRMPWRAQTRPAGHAWRPGGRGPERGSRAPSPQPATRESSRRLRRGPGRSAGRPACTVGSPGMLRRGAGRALPADAVCPRRWGACPPRAGRRNAACAGGGCCLRTRARRVLCRSRVATAAWRVDGTMGSGLAPAWAGPSLELKERARCNSQERRGTCSKSSPIDEKHAGFAGEEGCMYNVESNR